MKKLLITTVIALFSLSAFAQLDEGPEGIRFGMQLTPTISWFSTDETSLVEPDGSVMGYSFGIVGDWFFKRNYALSTGLLVDALGGKLDYHNMQLETKNDGIVTMNGPVTLRPTYLEMPIGFKFLTKSFWRMRFVGQAGYNQFILLNSTVRTDQVAVDSEGASVDIDKKSVRNEFSALMSGYHFGFGAEYSLGGEAYLTASILTTIGMNDVTKSTDDAGVDPVNKLNSINFKLGIIF